jgi:hypothetical protein
MNPSLRRSGQGMVPPVAAPMTTVPSQTEDAPPQIQGVPASDVPIGPQISPTPIGVTTGMEMGNPPANVPYYGLSPTGQPLDAQGYPIKGWGISPTVFWVAGAVVLTVLVMRSGRSRSATRRNPSRRHHRR